MKSKGVVDELREALKRVRENRFDYVVVVKYLVDKYCDNFGTGSYQVTIANEETGDVIFDNIVGKHDYSKEMLKFNLSQYTGLNF
jgi:hypothetical protein